MFSGRMRGLPSDMNHTPKLLLRGQAKNKRKTLIMKPRMRSFLEPGLDWVLAAYTGQAWT